MLRPQPRGIAGSRGPTSGLTSHDIAADVAAVVSELGNGRAVLLGPAVASTVATDYPELAVVVVLAASQVPRTPPNVSTTPFLIANATFPDRKRDRAGSRAACYPATGLFPIRPRRWHLARRLILRHAQDATRSGRCDAAVRLPSVR